MRAARTVTVIPPIIELSLHGKLNTHTKRRVAGYARVSTDQDEQLNSYEAQVDFYTDYIKGREDWDFVEVYTDEGISATSTAKREGFKRMIKDALAGEIDLIVTKSVSRFARNTVDTLTTIRQLKEKGVEVFFQKENIYTMDSKGELLITIMSSLAQEESRSISENVTWGQRKRMQDGKVSMPYKRFLGYEKGDNGQPKIIESEAVTVRLIYAIYLQGKTYGNIADHLTASGIPTPAGKLSKWNASTIKSILQNEKYAGNALLQKGYTVDFLTKKTKKNEGEVPQYYVENSHPGIITPEVYDMVQAEIVRRKGRGSNQSGLHCFSGKVICGECSGTFGSKVWHSTSKYRRVIWQCNNKFTKAGSPCGGTRCKTPHLTEDMLQRLFVEAFNRLYADRVGLMEDYTNIISALTDTASLDKKAAALSEECAVVMELVRDGINENAHTEQNQDDYSKRHEGLIARYEKAKSQLEGVYAEKQARNAKREGMARFVAELDKCGGLLEGFDESLWYSMIETVTVGEAGVAFAFKDGTVIDVNI